MTPSSDQWDNLAQTLRPDSDLDAVAAQLRPWPAALRCAPTAWRRQGDPRLALCRSLSGVYRHRDGRSHGYLRLHADGETYTASISSPKSVVEVWHDVHRWFGRDLSLPDHVMRHRYSFDGELLVFQYHSKWTREDFCVRARFDAEGDLRVVFHNETRGTASPERTYTYVGDSPDVDPVLADLNQDPPGTLARRLLGVSLDLARAIVQHREAHGPFTSADQLTAVRGVGPETLKMCRHLIAAP